MNIYITLDYELFFGLKSGNINDTIIKPTQEILKIVDKYNVKLVFFIDVGYLIKLEEQKETYPSLANDYNKITSQIKAFVKNGHTAELHIHPHWEDSFYDGKKWIFNTARYKLSDFSEHEIKKITKKYTSTLAVISGKTPKAFRAGGWSAQPFKKIGAALNQVGIHIDSSVFPQGYYNSDEQFYDFKKVPEYSSRYHFSDDLAREDPEGKFTEFPISSYKVSPFFFWKFALIKLMKPKKHIAYGDGFAISKHKKDVIKLMLTSSYSVVSIDGYKASYLDKAFAKYKKQTRDK